MYKIAVLDDDEHWCFTIQRFLRNHFDVVTYTDIHSFMRSQETFDLVIVDFTLLPTREFEALINGCELIRYLKRTLSHPPLMVLASGYISRSDLEDSGLLKDESLCAEADMFLAKDAGLEIVLAQIQQLLANRSALES